MGTIQCRRLRHFQCLGCVQYVLIKEFVALRRNGISRLLPTSQKKCELRIGVCTTQANNKIRFAWKGGTFHSRSGIYKLIEPTYSVSSCDRKETEVKAYDSDGNFSLHRLTTSIRVSWADVRSRCARCLERHRIRSRGGVPCGPPLSQCLKANGCSRST